MLNVAVVVIMLQDLRLLYPRCLLLHSQQKWPEFVQCAEQVLFGHFNVIFKEAHLNGKWSKQISCNKVQSLLTVWPLSTLPAVDILIKVL